MPRHSITLTLDGIATILKQYRAATENAAAAGFDGVEIHSANGPSAVCLGLGFLLSRYSTRIGVTVRVDVYNTNSS
jgi:hypothetical protein